ncbi:MAG TPA: phenazine biosynthesis protein [Firmicutes bacterium]|nr:phenazine biosynthesis protein [Bacillota bacterium]
MQTLLYYIVDVFAEQKYAGNQLAVIRNAGSLNAEQMQSITREMNFAETTFILSDTVRDNGYDVRIFTPEAEVPFAGHPTLGTAFIIQREIIKNPVDSLSLNLNVGKIPVRFSNAEKDPDILWMRQIQPEFDLTLSPEQIAPILNLDIAAIDQKYCIQKVSTGLPFFIVPLKTLSAIQSCRINHNLLVQLLKGTATEGILVFCPETADKSADLHVRVFVDCCSFPEDPATGSANGCLAGYLIKYRYFEREKIKLRVEQGLEIDRPSLLLLDAEQSGDMINISVGGKVVMVGRGELL